MFIYFKMHKQPECKKTISSFIKKLFSENEYPAGTPINFIPRSIADDAEIGIIIPAPGASAVRP